MTYLFPAIRGKMGSTTFYQANLKARELAAVAKPGCTDSVAVRD